MAAQQVLWPVFAMVLLAAWVMFRMFFERKRQVAAEGIAMREIPSGSQMAARFADTRAADNYRNLFEMPVFFYVAALVAYTGDMATPVVVGLAWAYVFLRAVHTAIHCGGNRIRHRLQAFFASNLALWALWVAIGVQLAKA